MKINLRSLDAAKHMLCIRLPSTLFFVAEKKAKLIPSVFQVYKLCINSKDKKHTVYLLIVRIYKVGAPKEWLQFMDTIKRVIKGQGITHFDTDLHIGKESTAWRYPTCYSEQRGNLQG
eukprot:2136698-Ditylum_brightwellii.AAC.1